MKGVIFMSDNDRGGAFWGCGGGFDWIWIVVIIVVILLFFPGIFGGNNNNCNGPYKD